MSADKYPSIFSRQMKAIVYILYGESGVAQIKYLWKYWDCLPGHKGVLCFLYHALCGVFV